MSKRRKMTWEIKICQFSTSCSYRISSWGPPSHYTRVLIIPNGKIIPACLICMYEEIRYVNFQRAKISIYYVCLIFQWICTNFESWHQIKSKLFKSNQHFLITSANLQCWKLQNCKLTRQTRSGNGILKWNIICMRSCVTRPLLEKNLIWFFNLHTYFVLVTLVE